MFHRMLPLLRLILQSCAHGANWRQRRAACQPPRRQARALQGSDRRKRRGARPWFGLGALPLLGLVLACAGACHGGAQNTLALTYAGQPTVFLDAVDLTDVERARLDRLAQRLSTEPPSVLTPFRTQRNSLVVATGRLIVAFQPDATDAAKGRIEARVAPQRARRLGDFGVVWNVGASWVRTLRWLHASPEVRWVEPELAIPIARRALPNDPWFGHQWNLRNTGQAGASPGADMDILGAWERTCGSSDVVIAIIDDGVEQAHEDLGAERVLPTIDVTSEPLDPSRAPTQYHGTACAGVAAASANNGLGGTGVCPQCRILPVRIFPEPAPDADGVELVPATWAAEAIVRAVDEGADILSNSWGPPDGEGAVPLPSVVREAIDYATTHGRQGRGALVLFAAGNGGEDLAGDGFASYSGTIAVGATTPLDIRAIYSDFGEALDICAPSAGETRTTSMLGIWTTDLSGKGGLNPGGDGFDGDRRGHYTSQFYGTSASCPAVAGVLGLMLSANPHLTGVQARQVLRDTAVKVDFADGSYDAQGHSRYYGFGRVDAAAAVRAAEALGGGTSGSSSLGCAPPSAVSPPCAAVGAAGRCDPRGVVACEDGDVRLFACVEGTSCLVDEERGAHCGGCGMLQAGQRACDADVLLSCGLDNQGRERLFRSACAEMCEPSEDGRPWARCTCAAEAPAGRCDGMALVRCGGTPPRSHTVQCARGCQIDAVSGFAHCSCESISHAGRCDGNVLQFCGVDSGVPEQYDCQHGCVSDGVARCACPLTPGACVDGTRWDCDRYGRLEAQGPCLAQGASPEDAGGDARCSIGSRRSERDALPFVLAVAAALRSLRRRRRHCVVIRRSRWVGGLRQAPWLGAAGSGLRLPRAQALPRVRPFPSRYPLRARCTRRAPCPPWRIPSTATVASRCV